MCRSHHLKKNKRMYFVSVFFNGLFVVSVNTLFTNLILFCRAHARESRSLHRCFCVPGATTNCLWSSLSKYLCSICQNKVFFFHFNLIIKTKNYSNWCVWKAFRLFQWEFLNVKIKIFRPFFSLILPLSLIFFPSFLSFPFPSSNSALPLILSQSFT